MTVRKYLCHFIGGPEDPPFRVPIEDDSDYQASSGSSCMVMDLRTHEDYVARGGNALITLDCPDALHALLAARYSLVEVSGLTPKAVIDAVIGPEATNEQFRNPDEYLSRIEARRAQRRKAERAAARAR